MRMKNKIAIISILVVFFLSFYVQNQYAIFSIDDWTYTFIVNENALNYQAVTEDSIIRQPVSSFSDAIISQSRDYFKTAPSNGRFIIHTLVQYICGTKTMSQFIILNSLMFIAFTILIIKLTDDIPNIWNLLFILSAIWILLPHKGLTFMGNVTCSVDYLWSSVGTLLFIFFLIWLKNHQKKHISLFIMIALTIYAFIAGALQESFTIGVSGALLFYILFNRRKINKELLVITLTYMIGTLVCIISPANFQRFDAIGGMGFHPNCILGLFSSPVFIIFIGIMIVLTIKGKFKSTIKINYIIVVPIIINLLFTIFIAYNGRHQLTAINVFCLIFIIRIWMEYASYNIKRITSILLTTIALISYFPILQARKEYYDSYQTILNRIDNENNNGIVSGKEFENNTERIKRNRILECNYIMTFTFQDWDFFERSLSVYITQGKDNKKVKEITK